MQIQTISKTASEHHLSYLLSRLDPNDYYARLMQKNPELIEQAARLNLDIREEDAAHEAAYKSGKVTVNRGRNEEPGLGTR